MTDAVMSLRTLAETSADVDVLHGMIGFAAHWLMELEVAGQTGAAHGEKSPERLAPRNGYRIGTGRRGVARSSCAFSI